MTCTYGTNSDRHRQQEQGADFVHVGCFHPSILRYFQFFPIQPMISTGFPASPVVPSWTSGIYAGFHPISLRPDEINPPGPPERSSWRSLSVAAIKGAGMMVPADDNLPGPHAIAGGDHRRSLDRAGWIGWRCSLPIEGIVAVVGIGRTHSVDHRTEHRNPRVVELPSRSLDLGRPTDLEPGREQGAIGPASQHERIGQPAGQEESR